MKTKEKIFTPNPEKDAIVARVLIHLQNYELLKAQKIILLNMQTKSETTSPEFDAIEGIVSMIDALQDIATDHYGYDEKTVFNLNSKMSLKQAEKIVKEKD